MQQWTLSFTPTFLNELLGLPQKVSKQVSQKVKVLEQDPISARGDARKLGGATNNVYRVRVGNYRLFYSFGQGWVKLLSVRKRDERTYADSIPGFAAPNTPPPDAALLDPQMQAGPATGYQVPTEQDHDGDTLLPAPTDRPSAPGTPLPVTLTEDLLRQWQIPPDYWPDLVAVQDEDALLNVVLPDKLLARILDNLFPRSIAEIDRQPEYILKTPEDLDRAVMGDLTSFLLKLDTDQQRLLDANPPHILLTNYMMLEYLLVRPADRDNIFANHRCRFLVLDEAHTYRGTLGSNIALLVRRLRAHLAQARQDWYTAVPERDQTQRFPSLIPVGTSATIKSMAADEVTPGDARRQRDQAVQTFFSAISGAAPDTIRVISEQVQTPAAPSDGEPDIGIYLNRWLVQTPLSVSQIVARLRQEVPAHQHTAPDDLATAVLATLTTGATLEEGTAGALRPRVHRFIRGGWQFHRCLEPTCGQLVPMGETSCACGGTTAPLYLCRNCGAHYLRLVGDPDHGPLRPSTDPGDGPEWMLYDHQRFETLIEDEEDSDVDERRAAPRSPSSHGRQSARVRGRPILTGSFDPATRTFSADPGDYALKVKLVPARTRCLCCGGTAGSRNVITPVSLGTSAAVKVLSEALVEGLAAANRDRPDHDGKERLLVFSDSRQDAAHQARFISFASRYDRMRRRVVQVLAEADTPLSLQRVVEHLAQAAVARRDNPHLPTNRDRITAEELQRIRAWEEAPLLDDLAVNAGYRATIIKLGLVSIGYEGLAGYVVERGAALATTLGIAREHLVYLGRCLLDEMRTRGCLARPLLCYHPAHPACPDALRAAEWERRMVQPQGYVLSDQHEPVAFRDSTDFPPGMRVHNAWRRPGAGGRSPSLQRVMTHLLNQMGASRPRPRICLPCCYSCCAAAFSLKQRSTARANRPTCYRSMPRPCNSSVPTRIAGCAAPPAERWCSTPRRDGPARTVPDIWWPGTGLKQRTPTGTSGAFSRRKSFLCLRMNIPPRYPAMHAVPWKTSLKRPPQLPRTICRPAHPPWKWVLMWAAWMPLCSATFHHAPTTMPSGVGVPVGVHGWAWW